MKRISSVFTIHMTWSLNTWVNIVTKKPVQRVRSVCTLYICYFARKVLSVLFANQTSICTVCPVPFRQKTTYMKSWDKTSLCKSQPRWLSWMRRPTGDQEVAGSTPAEVGNILSWRLIMKYFLRSFSPFR